MRSQRQPFDAVTAYRYLREHHGTSDATAPYCEDCGVPVPCPVMLLLDEYDRLRDAETEAASGRLRAWLRSRGITVDPFR